MYSDMWSAFLTLCFIPLGSSLTKSQSTLQWTTHPSTQTVETGNTVSFRCSATYERKILKYHWQHESATIQADSEPRFTVQADGTLVITNVKVEDRGTYQCYVTREGRDKILGRSNVATLTVKGKLAQAIRTLLSRDFQGRNFACPAGFIAFVHYWDFWWFIFRFLSWV